jgi:TPR repeat protein
VTADPKEAAKWFTRAAELQNSTAMYLLGQMYWKGDGLKPDKVKAYTWMWLAASAAVPGAREDVDRLTQQMQDKDVADAQKNARKWASQHVAFGLRKNRQIIPSN